MLPPGRATIRVPILMYHYVRDADPAGRLGFGLSVRPADFRAQLDLLRERGFHPVTMTEVDDYLDGQGPLPRGAVVLTFDDGYADFWSTALPALQARGFSAVAYIVPGFLGRPAYMTAAEVAGLGAQGVEVGSHTVNHLDLTTLPPSRLKLEVEESRSRLQSLTGTPVEDFCYPSGRFSPAVQEAVRAAGYRSATTTAPGSEESAAHRLQLGRVRVSGGESLAEFGRLLGAPSG